MIEVAQARRKILDCARRLKPRRVALPDAAGLVLAENVKADRDLPPFDRARMDGYAVRAADVTGAWSELDVVSDAPAGSSAAVLLHRGQCARISTGAPLPAGADSVVMVERSEAVGGRRVRLAGPVTSRQHVAPRGEEARRGRVLAPRGTLLTPARTGLLAMVGHTKPLVQPAPSVAVLATGNELVGLEDQPARQQIRDSNSVLVEAMLGRLGVREVRPLGIARDRRGHLARCLRRGLESDLLLTSGGVSVGDCDLVPQALAELGCRIVIHKVAMRPGKPFLFAEGPAGQLVFGLPGNPVAVLVTLLEFAGPAVRKLMGRSPEVRERRARLRAPCSKEPGRMAFLPARTVCRPGGPETEPIAWHGSADLVAASQANSLIVLPRSVRRKAAGRMVAVHLLEDGLGLADE